MRWISISVSTVQFGKLRSQSVAVEGIVVPRLGLQHELAAPRFREGRLLGLVGGSRRRHLAAELIRSSGSTLAGTFDLRSVQRIDLAAASVSVAVKPS